MSDVTINYNNETIATIDSSGTKTLRTDGKICDGDISVNYTGGGITPSGSISITENGTYDVTEKASAVVNVSGITPSGTRTLTANGTYDVTNYASAVVNVSSGGGTHKVTLKNSAYYYVCGQCVVYNSTEYYTAGDVIDVADGDSITLHDSYSVTIDGVASTTITTYTPTCDCTISFNVYYAGEGTYQKLYYIATNGYYYLEDKTITTNGTYEADDYYDGLGTVTVDTESLTPATVTITKSSFGNYLYYMDTNGNASSASYITSPLGDTITLPLNSIVYSTTSVTVTGMTALTTNVYRVTSTTATIS